MPKDQEDEYIDTNCIKPNQYKSKHEWAKNMMLRNVKTNSNKLMGLGAYEQSSKSTEQVGAPGHFPVKTHTNISVKFIATQRLVLEGNYCQSQL